MEEVEEKQLCHSCGIVINEDIYGTNADGTKNKEFCKFCYKNGKQTNIAFSLLELLDGAADASVKEMKS